MENKEFVGEHGEIVTLSESTTMDDAVQVCRILDRYMHWENNKIVWADDTPEWVKRLREAFIEWKHKYMPTR